MQGISKVWYTTLSADVSALFFFGMVSSDEQEFENPQGF